MGAEASKLPEPVAVEKLSENPPSPPPPAEGEKKKCKACCACPETKRVRDDCIVSKGEENCQDLIEAHRKCMREAGFNI